MKKLFVLILTGLLLHSCNSYLGKKLSKKSAEDIKVEKIKDACDCIEALDIIAADYLDVVGKNDKESIDNMNIKERQKFDKKEAPIKAKREEVSSFCRKKFGISHSDFTRGSACKLYKDLKEKNDMIEEKF